MSKVNKCVVFLFLAWFSLARGAAAWPLPTESMSETFEAISQAQSELQAVKSEIDSTVNLVKQISNMGVTGFLKAFLPTDLKSFAKQVASKGYDLYKTRQKNKKQAKANAQQTSAKNAKEKAKAQKEGKDAAVAAVDKNRETAKKNRENKFKKAMSWVNKTSTKVSTGIKTGTTAARNWTNTQATKAGDWTKSQKTKLTNSITGANKNSK